MENQPQKVEQVSQINNIQNVENSPETIQQSTQVNNIQNQVENKPETSQQVGQVNNLPNQGENIQLQNQVENKQEVISTQNQIENKQQAANAQNPAENKQQAVNFENIIDNKPSQSVENTQSQIIYKQPEEIVSNRPQLVTEIINNSVKPQETNSLLFKDSPSNLKLEDVVFNGVQGPQFEVTMASPSLDNYKIASPTPDVLSPNDPNKKITPELIPDKTLSKSTLDVGIKDVIRINVPSSSVELTTKRQYLDSNPRVLNSYSHVTIDSPNDFHFIQSDKNDPTSQKLKEIKDRAGNLFHKLGFDNEYQNQITYNVTTTNKYDEIPVKKEEKQNEKDDKTNEMLKEAGANLIETTDGTYHGVIIIPNEKNIGDEQTISEATNDVN